MGLSIINHPAIGVPPWPWTPPSQDHNEVSGAWRMARILRVLRTARMARLVRLMPELPGMVSPWVSGRSHGPMTG